MQAVRKIFILVAASLAMAQSLWAVPMTGQFSFGGKAKLDGATVSASSKVNTWGAFNSVTAASGSFIGLVGLSVNLGAPWSFNSGPLNNFWSVGGFQFNLSTSSAFDDFGGVLTVIISGTMTGNSYDPTQFLGRMKIYNPATAKGKFTYTGSLEFATIPDGGSTVLLLGATMLGFVLIRRKSPAA